MNFIDVCSLGRFATDADPVSVRIAKLELDKTVKHSLRPPKQLRLLLNSGRNFEHLYCSGNVSGENPEHQRNIAGWPPRWRLAARELLVDTQTFDLLRHCPASC